VRETLFIDVSSFEVLNVPREMKLQSICLGNFDWNVMKL